jgi:hypothetical protein
MTPPHITEGLTDADLAAMGLKYNGYQEGFQDVPGGHLYTRLDYPKTTFMVGPDETIRQSQQRLLNAFANGMTYLNKDAVKAIRKNLNRKSEMDARERRINIKFALTWIVFFLAVALVYWGTK